MGDKTLSVGRGPQHSEEDMIPLFWPPEIDMDRLKLELFDPDQGTFQGRWWGQGPKVNMFEKEFGERFGFKHSVMTNSGTMALWIAYVLAGIGKGDEVIVPVLTCTATCHPLLWLGAKIIFADIDPETLTLDPSDFESRITEKTKAVVPVHLGGLVAHAEEIKNIARRAGKIRIIEDACQALGAKSVGYGDFTCFSFQAIKALTTEDGGMLVTRCKRDYSRAKRLRWFAIDREAKSRAGWQAWTRRGITFEQEEPGLKAQPTDIDASVGFASMSRFGPNQAHRARIAQIYRQELGNLRAVKLLREGDTSNWLFMVKVEDRDDFARFLWKNGIETNVAHLRNDIFKVFGGRRLDLPGMRQVEKKYICLPINTKMSESDAYYIAGAIINWHLKRFPDS